MRNKTVIQINKLCTLYDVEFWKKLMSSYCITYWRYVKKHEYIKLCVYLVQWLSNFFLAYHCQNTKHVHVPLSEYKTRTRTTVTIQNTYTYHCHNTKHVRLSQYKTRTHTTVTIQNIIYLFYLQGNINYMKQHTPFFFKEIEFHHILIL
jgi:hypothetical protein